LTGNENKVAEIITAHRQAMLAENIVGNFLEEYIDEVLQGTKWICCYGETLKYSDFCHPEGYVVQIKNRNNTENSSSKKIRKNTKIKMWFRTFNQNGKTNWPEIYKVFRAIESNGKYKIDGKEVRFSEDGFRAFVSRVIKSNPDCIYNEQ
jgi:hypothetical protein